MSAEPPDYFAWLKTGHFNLIFSTFFGAWSVWSLVVAIDRGVTGATVLYSVFVLGCAFGLVCGVREYRAYRSARRA